MPTPHISLSDAHLGGLVEAAALRGWTFQGGSDHI